MAASSSQVIFESFLASATGPPRTLQYFSAIVFNPQIADAYLVERSSVVAHAATAGASFSPSGGQQASPSSMHYVAQASPELIMEWIDAAVTDLTAEGRQHQQKLKQQQNEETICGIFVRDPVLLTTTEEDPAADQLEETNINATLMDTAGAIPFSTQSRMMLLSRQKQQQQQQQHTSPEHQKRAAAAAAAAENEENSLPPSAVASHTFLTQTQVEELVRKGTVSSSSALSGCCTAGRDWIGVLFLVESLPLRSFGWCEVTMYGSTISSAVWKDPVNASSSSSSFSSSSRRATPSPAATVQTPKKQQRQKSTKQPVAAATTITVDAHEKRKLEKVLHPVAHLLDKMNQHCSSSEASYSSSSTVACKFFLMFLPSTAADTAGGVGRGGTEGGPAVTPADHFYEVNRMKKQYSKAQVGARRIDWHPRHMKPSTTSDGRSSSSSGNKTQQQNQHFGTSITTQNNDRESTSGEWFFLGAHITGPSAADFLGAVSHLLDEMRPQRLEIQHRIQKEDEAAAERRKQQQQQQQKQPRRRGSPTSSRLDDDDISWDRDVHRTGSANNSNRPTSPLSTAGGGAQQQQQQQQQPRESTPNGRPPRPASGPGSEQQLALSSHEDNSAAATRASSAAAAAIDPLSPVQMQSAEQTNLSSSVVHPGALLVVGGSNRQPNQQSNNFTNAAEFAEQIPTIHEMWDRRLRTGGARRAVVSGNFDRAMRKEESLRHQQIILSHAATPLPGHRNNNNQHQLVVSSSSAAATPPPAAASYSRNSVVLSSPSPSSPSPAAFEMAAKQLRLSPGTTFGPVPASGKKIRESKFVSRLSRFLDDEHGRLVQRQVDEENERARQIALAQQAEDAAAAASAEKARRAALEAQRSADDEAAQLAAKREREAGGGHGGADGANSPRSRAEMRRLLLMRSAASNSTPLEKIKIIYDVSSFHLALERAYMDLFSEKLEKQPRDSSVSFSGGGGGGGDQQQSPLGKDPSSTSKRQVRLPSEIQAREAIDFFADVGIMAEIEEVLLASDEEDEETDSSEDDDNNQQRSEGENESSSDNDDDDYQQQQQQLLRARRSSVSNLARRHSSVGKLKGHQQQRRSSSPSPVDPDDENDDDAQRKKNKKKNKKGNGTTKPTPLQLALAGCAPPVVVTLHVPDSSRIAARLLASTLWKAESTAKSLEKLNRWQLDTWFHMYEHGTASLHRCLELVLFQQQKQQGGKNSPPSSPNSNNNLSSSNVIDDGNAAAAPAAKDKDAAEAERREAAERAAAIAAEEQAAAMKAHAARLLEIQHFLHEEEFKRGKVLQMEQTNRALVLSMEGDHVGFLRSVFPEWVAAAVTGQLQQQQQQQRGASSSPGGGGGGGGDFAGHGSGTSGGGSGDGSRNNGGLFGYNPDCPALNLFAEAAMMKREVDLAQLEERQQSEASQERGRRDLAVQEVERRIELEKMQTNARNGAAHKQRVREQKEVEDRERVRKEQERREQAEVAREARHRSARGGRLPLEAEMFAEMKALRDLLVSGFINSEESRARSWLVREKMMAPFLRMAQICVACGAGNRTALFMMENILASASSDVAAAAEVVGSADAFSADNYSDHIKTLSVADIVPKKNNFHHLCLLRDTIVESTFFLQEQQKRERIEKEFFSTFVASENFLPRLCNGMLVARSRGRNDPSTDAPQQWSNRLAASRARKLLVAERLCALETAARRELVEQAVQQGILMILTARSAAATTENASAANAAAAAPSPRYEVILRQVDNMILSHQIRRGGQQQQLTRKRLRPSDEDVHVLRRVLEESAMMHRESDARNRAVTEFWIGVRGDLKMKL